MPGIIYKLDGWKPKDHTTTQDLRKEQRDNLRRLIGESLWGILEKMIRGCDQKRGEHGD